MKGPNYDDGGGAFPSHEMLQTGMTLRDYFAAAAMPIVANAMSLRTKMDADFDPARFAAAMAYTIADAMLKRRTE